MKLKILLNLIFLIAYFGSYCQKDCPDTAVGSSIIIKNVSYFWKLDSLGSNGFRLYAAKYILKSKIDSISIDFLTKNLGKPNMIRNTNKGPQILYFTFDSKKLPKSFGRLDCVYLLFQFNQIKKSLLSITEGSLDY